MNQRQQCSNSKWFTHTTATKTARKPTLKQEQKKKNSIIYDTKFIHLVYILLLYLINSTLYLYITSYTKRAKKKKRRTIVTFCFCIANKNINKTKNGVDNTRLYNKHLKCLEVHDI